MLPSTVPGSALVVKRQGREGSQRPTRPAIGPASVKVETRHRKYGGHWASQQLIGQDGDSSKRRPCGFSLGVPPPLIGEQPRCRCRQPIGRGAGYCKGFLSSGCWGRSRPPCAVTVRSIALGITSHHYFFMYVHSAGSRPSRSA